MVLRLIRRPSEAPINDHWYQLGFCVTYYASAINDIRPPTLEDLLKLTRGRVGVDSDRRLSGG